MIDYRKITILENMLEEADNKDAMIKYLIETADFEIAYYLVCKYVTKRSVQDLHKSISTIQYLQKYCYYQYRSR